MAEDFQFGRGQHGRQFAAPPAVDEAAEFEAHSAELAEALQSPWQPRCIARAWATRGVGELEFTLQAWIDLDAVCSPLLEGGAPETAADIAGAFRAFGLAFDAATPAEDAALIICAMQREIAAGFAAALPMQPPEAETEPEGVDGFGSWIPLLTCLITQCGLTPGDALRLGVAQARMLVATHRRNQGWRVAGEPYALREVEGERSTLNAQRSTLNKEEAARG